MIPRQALVGALAAGIIVSCSPKPRELRVLAASSLTEVIEEAARRFEKTGGLRVSASFGASSILAQQIMHGAQADVFISADEAWMDNLEQKRLLNSATRKDLCGNQLALIAPKGAPPWAGWPGLLTPRVRRIALGDPDHVPAGRYAKQALSNLGLWDGLKSKILPVVDARAALAYVERWEAEYGVVYATDAALSERVIVQRIFPQNTHATIVYPGTVLAQARHAVEAEAFLDFLTSAQFKETWKRSGFRLLNNH